MIRKMNQKTVAQYLRVFMLTAILWRSSDCKPLSLSPEELASYQYSILFPVETLENSNSQINTRFQILKAATTQKPVEENDSSWIIAEEDEPTFQQRQRPQEKKKDNWIFEDDNEISFRKNENRKSYMNKVNAYVDPCEIGFRNRFSKKSSGKLVKCPVGNGKG